MMDGSSIVNRVSGAEQHAERVNAVLDGVSRVPGLPNMVESSWRRCARQFDVNPASGEAPRILTATEFQAHRLPVGPLIEVASEEIDRLYRTVRDVGYAVFLCDGAGIAINHRIDGAQEGEFKKWGIWLGGVWAEEFEGTNAIGTCITEQRPVTVHQSEHYRSRYLNLSCSGAPIFDVDGSLLGVLDVSAVNPELSERAHALTGSLTERSARAITERLFRDRFRRQWIVAVAMPGEDVPGMLIAVDQNQRIVGADRAARTRLSLDDRSLQEGVGLWTIFEQNGGLFRRRDGTDSPVSLIGAKSRNVLPSLVTAPESTLNSNRNSANSTLHVRPRLESLTTLVVAPPPQAMRGRIAPSALRRVVDYVEENLDKPIDLSKMAARAGISVYHFARGFKQATGETPHSYLTRRRVEHAKEVLARGERSLTEIALEVGFYDQSHLARHFRQMVGVSPAEFRRMRRHVVPRS